jgi:hypothetical protein
MGKANSKGEAQAGALAFLDKLQAAAARWTPFSQADRSEETARFLRPAEHDPLIDWIEATDNSPRLVALVDEVLPGEVARRSCCAHPEKRVAWRDPIAGLQEEPGSLAPPWTWAGGDRYQEHRDDLLAIVAEVRRLVEGGALVARSEAREDGTAAEESPTEAQSDASPQAIATALLLEGKTITEVANRLGVRRQDIYEKPEWALVLHFHKSRGGARRQARDDRRRRFGQDPDTLRNRDDA